MGKRISGRPVPITEVRPDVPPGLVRALDKLLASKPQDRFQTAGEAAEALQDLIKPRPRTSSPSGSKGGAPRDSSPVAPSPPVAERVVVEVPPDFPAWFRPLARAAEETPGITLAAAILVLGLIFLSGLLLGWLLYA
jgi:serine/threonine-protein kinase